MLTKGMFVFFLLQYSKIMYLLFKKKKGMHLKGIFILSFGIFMLDSWFFLSKKLLICAYLNDGWDTT